MAKKHNGSKKSKSQRQSRIQQWIERYTPFVDKNGNSWIHRGNNRAQNRANESKFRKFDQGEQWSIDKGTRKRIAKAKRRARRRNARTLHQAQRRAS